MDILRNWIMAVTAASLLLSVAMTMGRGPLRRFVRLAGGRVLFVAVLSPIRQITSSDMAFQLTESRAVTEGYADALIFENSIMIKEIIAERTRTYILQKATELGLDCEAAIETEQREDGYPYPTAVVITAVGEEDAKGELRRIILAELGIENQTWIE